MRMLLRVMLLGLFATAKMHARAGADPAADKASATRLAKQYVDAGLAAQNAGDYDTAITLYTKAYELVPHPLLIFNLAQANRLAGRTEQALELYEKYLAQDPKGAQAQLARDLVAELRAKADERAAEPPDKPAEDGKPEDGKPDDGKPDDGELLVTAKSQRGTAITRGSVTIDGQRAGELGGGALKLKVPEGHHAVAIEATGYQRFEDEVTARGGEQATLDAQLVEVAPRRRSSLWKWSLGVSLGVATIGAGFTVYEWRQQLVNASESMAGLTEADCGRAGLADPAFRAACTAHGRYLLGLGISAVAGAGAVVSLIMLLRDPGTPEPATPGTRGKKRDVALVPIVAPGGGGASLSLTW